MKTKRVHGFVLAATLAVIAACSGTQGETSYNEDGGIVTDAHLAVDTGVQIIGTPDVGTVSTPDTGSTFIDTGTGSSPDTGTGTGTTGDSGGVCPGSCAADTDCGTCPETPGAINCCDTVTSACFTSSASSCPDTTSTGGGTDSGGGGGY